MLYPITKTVDRNEVWFLIPGKPDIMDVAKKQFLNHSTGINVVHVGVDNHLEHHLRMIGATTIFFIKSLIVIKVKILNEGIDIQDRVIFSNIFINPDGKKKRLVGYIRAKT